MPDEYRVRDPETDELIANQTTVEIGDAVNRFARSASATFIDRGSDLLDEFVDYTVWDIDIKPLGSDTWERRFSGFVVEQDYDQSETSVDFLSHDHWLKRRKVDREFVNADGTEIVMSLVEDFTPLSVDPADVEWEDEPTEINEAFKGVTPAEIIATLTEGSANEQFGATNDLEFFLRPFEAGNGSTNDLELTPGRYRSTDWEDDSRSQINQVRVKYGADGNNEVVVSDKDAQKAIGDSIGVDQGVILEQSKTFEGIPADDRSSAREKAEAILQRGEPIQIGEISTFNVGQVRPGQIVPVEDPDAGVDGEFRVADVQLDATGLDTLLVAENREGVIDKLASLSEEQDRIEAREGELDPDTSTEFLTGAFDFEVEWNATLLRRAFLDRQLLLGSESFDGSGQRFDAPGGLLGHEFSIQDENDLTVAADTTETVESAGRLDVSNIELNGELALEGVVRIGATTPQATAGGLLGDGFKTQTTLTTTQ